MFDIGDVHVVTSVPPGVKEPLEGCADACAGMGSTLVNNTFIFSFFEVKLREMLTNLSISFLETLTDIVREAAFAIDLNANSRQQCFTCSSRETRVHIANLSFCATVNESNTEIDANFFGDMPGPIGDVLRNQTSDTPLFQPRDHVIGMQTCRSIDEDPSWSFAQNTTRNPRFLGEQRRQLLPLLHGLTKEQPSIGTE